MLEAGFFCVLCLTALWLSNRFFGHPFSPFGIFYCTWFGALGLFSLRLVDFIELRPPTWQLIYLNLTGFGLGWFLLYSLRSPGESLREPVPEVEFSEHHLRNLIGLCFLLGMIGLGNFLWNVHNVLGLQTYVEAPHEVRGAMGLGDLVEGLKLFNWLNVCNVMLCALYLGSGAKRRTAVIVVLGFSVVATLFMQDRTRFFFAVLWAAFTVLHAFKLRRRTVLIALATTVTLLTLQFLAVAVWLGKVAENSPILLKATAAEGILLIFITPYVYLTGNFPALQGFVESAPVSTGGSMTFYPLYQIIHLAFPAGKLPQYIGNYYAIPFDFNTYTWLQPFYSDFGNTGVFLGPFVVGMVSAWVYFQMRSYATVRNVLLNGLLSVGLTLSVFVNHLTQGPAWYFALLSIAFQAYLQPPSGRKVVSAG